MAAIFYEVNPADTTNVFRSDTNNRPYDEGAQNLVTRLTSIQIGRLGAEPIVQANIYLAAPDESPPPDDYYDEPVITTEFVGDIGDPAARVVETRTWTSLPLDAIRDAKLEELVNQTESVLDQGMVVSGVGDMRTTIAYQSYYHSIALNSLPGATTYKMPDLWGSFIQVRKDQIPSVEDALSTFHIAPTMGQTEVHEDEIERLYATAVASQQQADRDALAQYDVTTGYPTAPTPPTVTQRRRTNGGRAYPFDSRFVTLRGRDGRPSG